MRTQVEQALEHLSRNILRSPSGGDGQPGADRAELGRVQQLARFLGQVAAGLTEAPAEALSLEGAGLWSTVLVEDLERGERVHHTLMNGPLLDIEDGQVSLASPIGQALLGVRAGDVVDVETPQRTRRLRVVEVRTLEEVIREEVFDAATR